MIILSHKRNDESLELSVDFIKCLKRYLVENKLSLSQFCVKYGINEYGFRKALDPRIKMQLFPHTIMSLAEKIDIEKETIIGYTPLAQGMQDFENRNCLRA